MFSKKYIYERVGQEIDLGFSTEEVTLIDALPGMGKSYGVVKWAEETGEPLTILTERHDLYDQYEDWCEEFGLRYRTLPSLHALCPSIERDDQIGSRFRELYASGVSGAEVHRNPERYVGEPLPCQVEGECAFTEQRRFEPADYDVLIGHYLQAHNANYPEDRYLAFDEFPGDAFFTEFDHTDVTKAVKRYLSRSDRLPFDNWKDLFYNRNTLLRKPALDEWEQWVEEFDHRDSHVPRRSDSDYHAMAPLLTRATVEFDLLDNQWEWAEFGDGIRVVRSPDDEWTVLRLPDLSMAESVVALDGTPCPYKWRLVLGCEQLEHRAVLESDEERRMYLSEVLGLKIVQTDAGTKPYLSGASVNVESDAALLEGILRREGRPASVITSKQAREAFESAGVDRLIEEIGHYGKVKGRNNFATTRLGAVIGSPHPSEGEAVERWGALTGEAISRKTGEDGRVLRGEDLDLGKLGNTLFQDVVENEVLQAVMRFGREADETGKGATVYVHTSRLPEWVHPAEEVRLHENPAGMVEVIRTLRELEPEGNFKTALIADRTSIGGRQVTDHLQNLAEMGHLSHWQEGQGYAHHWSVNCLESVPDYGRISS